MDMDELKKLKADSRGRVNLGMEYAGKHVKVAIEEVDDDGD